MFEPKAGERNQAGKVTRRENGRRKAEQQSKEKRRSNSAPILFLVGWKMVYICAPLSRALQRDASQHRKLGVKAPLFASAACEVAPHVMLILVASPGFEDFVLIDGA